MIPSGYTLAANREGIPIGAYQRTMTIYPANHIAYLTYDLVEELGDPPYIALGYGAEGRVVIVASEQAERNVRKLHRRGNAGANTYVPVSMIRALSDLERPVNPIRIEFEEAENGIALGAVIAQEENEDE